MKRHVFHPLWVAIGLVGLIFVARIFLVPDDFGVHGDSFTYNFYRQGNVQEWKEFPVEFLPLNRERSLCLRCHSDLDFPASSARSDLPAIVDKRHKRNRECAECHNPHDPREEAE